MISAPLLLTGLFWLAALVFLAGLYRRASLWRAGRSARVAWAGLLAIPKRYFVDLHHVVAREPYIANTHVATAGGAVAAIVLVALNYGLAIYSRWLDGAIVVAAVVMLLGAFFMALRRRAPPPRLSRGPWSRLPYTLAAFALGLGLVVLLPTGAAAALIAAVALLLLLAGAAELALGIGLGGPMKHAVAGLLHLGLHPRPERFAARNEATALKLMPVDDAAQLGAERPIDFAWNRLLSFDACVQCGKCEAVCPAFAAGQPLNPKKLIQDLVAGMAATSDAAYAGSAYPGRDVGRHAGAPDAAIVPGLIEADTLWSCTTCRACVQECPMLIEHVDAVVELRRHQTMALGLLPGKGPEVLAALRETDTQGRFPLAARHHWAVDLELPILQPGQATEWLLLVGEGGYDMRYQRSLRALVKTLRHAGIEPALLGAAETDCGDLARRLGDEAGFQRLARQLIATLQAQTFQRIVTADPHLFHCLLREYPALGGRYEIVHHTQLLNQLLEQGKLKPTPTPAAATVTYHDPCYLGRYAGEISAPRLALKAIGIKVVEMERHAMRGRCCGGGGGAPFTDIAGTTRIPDLRMADARETGAAIVAVACPQCTAMLEGVVGPRPEVLDVAELVARSCGVAA